METEIAAGILKAFSTICFVIFIIYAPIWLFIKIDEWSYARFKKKHGYKY